jgi:carbon-monoxide dehydrogenase medium subunit
VTALVQLPDHVRPHTLAEAAALAARPGAVVLAGGTDLMNELRLGHVRPTLVVDLAAVEELGVLDEGDPVSIGAAVTVRRLLAATSVCDRYPVLADAGRLLGGRQIQASATVGGNVCHASPAAELATPLVALDATAVVEGPDGRRELPVEQLWAGPRRTTLAPGDLLVALRLPALGSARTSAYRRVELRRSVDIALVSASVDVPVVDGVVRGARVAVGAAAPTPILVPAAGEALEGVEPAGAALAAAVAAAGAACATAIRPIDDVRASAAYRRAMVEVVTVRAVAAALARAGT